MEKPKEWKAGVADKVWKINICSRDYQRADDILDWMGYILTDAGNDKERALKTLSEFTGKQIMNGLLAYRSKALKAIENGLSKPYLTYDDAPSPTEGLPVTVGSSPVRLN